MMKTTKNFKKRFIWLVAIIIFSITGVKSQESTSDLNGIWNNRQDSTLFYLFKDGEYLWICFNNEEGIIKDGFENGRYGFYSTNFDYKRFKKSGIGLSNISIESDSLAIVNSKGSFLGYEFETGDRIINLYNYNTFFFQKLFVLPQKAINQLRLIAKQKHIEIEKFLYSIETIGKDKAKIYSVPDVATKMYLVKGDKVKIIEQKNGWLKFEYRGTRIIKGWVKIGDLSDI